MKLLPYLILVATASYVVSVDTNKDRKWPTVGISILVRNKAHTLPYFFSCLENLDYPKDRIYFWIWSDYNQDNSDEIIEYWVIRNRPDYNDIYVHYNESSGTHYPDETSPTQWSNFRFSHVMTVRESALSFAKKHWADFHFMLDADVYLTDTSILKTLVSKDEPVLAPMLDSDGLYSNYWGAMSSVKYYKRSKKYRQIREREILGCFNVPMIHSAVLINLNDPITKHLTYNHRKIADYDGPMDDIIVFAISAKKRDVPLKICNEGIAGYIQIPLDAGDDLKKDLEQLINIKLLALAAGNELPLTPGLAEFVLYPEATKLTLNEIFMINLERRTERREYMEKCFKELGLYVKHFKAIDGLSLNLEDLPYDIKLLPGYEDPYHKRPMKTGEIGCFLSHYKIWEEVAAKGYRQAMVLEDDVFFRPHFRLNVRRLLREMLTIEWDLVYIGRKVLMLEEEKRATPFIVKPLYSYWTLGYIISAKGALKLLAAKPLAKMLPVDEFLPIMFNQHPNDTWKSYFPERNLIALSSDPLLVEPVRYVNQPGYVSDTELSILAVDDNGRLYPSYETPAHAGYEYLAEEELDKIPPEMFKIEL